MAFIFRVEHSIFQDDYRCALFRNLTRDGGGDREREAFVLTPQRVTAPGVLPDMFARDSYDGSVEKLLRAIVDGCARAGILPGDTTATLAAKDRHLADMRALAFGGLKIEAPR